jgi:hypothetical protein
MSLAADQPFRFQHCGLLRQRRGTQPRFARQLTRASIPVEQRADDPKARRMCHRAQEACSQIGRFR